MTQSLPEPTSAEPDRPAAPDRPAVPDEDHLRAVAEPARVRRAPRLRAFVVVGGLVGALAGIVATQVVRPADGVAQANVGATTFFMAVLLATAGVLVGSAVALWADRRSQAGER